MTEPTPPTANSAEPENTNSIDYCIRVCGQLVTKMHQLKFGVISVHVNNGVAIYIREETTEKLK